MPRMAANDRRNMLIEATVAVLLEKGFAGATTRDVSARLNIGRGLIHHYFPTWEALQHAAFAAVAQAAMAEAEAAIATLGGEARLEALMDRMIADPADAHWRLFADAWDEAQTDPALAQIYSDVSCAWRALIKRALLPVLADPLAEDAAWRLSAMADGLTGQVLLANAPLPRSKAIALLYYAARLEIATSPRLETGKRST
jgi:AcrR family transcriptional regulator